MRATYQDLNDSYDHRMRLLESIRHSHIREGDAANASAGIAGVTANPIQPRTLSAQASVSNEARGGSLI